MVKMDQRVMQLMSCVNYVLFCLCPLDEEDKYDDEVFFVFLQVVS